MLKAVMLGIIKLLPDLPKFDGLVEGVGALLGVFQKVNLIVSLPLISSCLLLVLVVYNIDFIMSFLMWIVRKLPTVS